MLTKAGVKLLDFGLAKHLATTVEARSRSSLPFQPARRRTTPHRAGNHHGDVPVHVPEQLEGKEADARTDIFAFGTVLYEMATGRKAFAGKSRASMIAAISRTGPPSLSRPSHPPRRLPSTG